MRKQRRRSAKRYSAAILKSQGTKVKYLFQYWCCDPPIYPSFCLVRAEFVAPVNIAARQKFHSFGSGAINSTLSPEASEVLGGQGCGKFSDAACRNIKLPFFVAAGLFVFLLSLNFTSACMEARRPVSAASTSMPPLRVRTSPLRRPPCRLPADLPEYNGSRAMGQPSPLET